MFYMYIGALQIPMMMMMMMILLLANPGPPGKWSLKWRESEVGSAV